MKRAAIVAALCSACMAAAPAAAQALPDYWEVYKAGWAKLALATPIPVATSATSIGMAGDVSGKGFKVSCTLSDSETIENETISEEGIDSMSAFTMSCGGPGALSVHPCVAGEAFTLTGKKLPWPSELYGTLYDAFENVELEVTCLSSGTTALYHSPGHLWTPKVVSGGLVSSATSGTFKNSPGNWFQLDGTDKMVPGGGYTKVR